MVWLVSKSKGLARKRLPLASNWKCLLCTDPFPSISSNRWVALISISRAENSATFPPTGIISETVSGLSEISCGAVLSSTGSSVTFMVKIFSSVALNSSDTSARMNRLAIVSRSSSEAVRSVPFPSILTNELCRAPTPDTSLKLRIASTSGSVPVNCPITVPMA